MKVIDAGASHLVPKLPPLPADVIQRFPSLLAWHAQMEEVFKKLNISIRGTP